MPYGSSPGQGYNDPVNNRIAVIAPGKNQGIFVYSPTAGTGNLVVSIAAVSGTDQYTNAYKGPGIEIQGAGDTGQSIFLGLVGPTAELQMPTGSGFEAAAANLFTGVVGSGATELMETGFSGPKGSTAGGTDWLQLLLSSNNQGATSSALSDMLYIDSSGVTHVLTTWKNNEFDIFCIAYITDQAADPVVGIGGGVLFYSKGGHFKYKAEDGNTYNTGHTTFICPSTQTIGAASPTNITGLSCPVSIGTYKFHANIVFNGNVAARIGNAISAPATSLAMVTYLWFNNGGAVAVSQATSAALGTGVLGPTMTAANQVLKIEGVATFTAAGTFALQADTSIAADNLFIQAGSTLDMFPIS
jgi:hypothetical protein